MQTYSETVAKEIEEVKNKIEQAEQKLNKY